MLPLLHHTAVLQMQTPFSLIQPNNVIDPRVAKFMCGNDASIADIELQAILHSGDKFVEVPNRFEVDDSIMHGMGKISRKIHVQVTLLNKLIAAQELLRENLMKTESWNVFKDLEMPLVSLLAQMEFGGVQLSIGRLDRSAESLKVFIKYTEERIISAVGPSYVRINLQSPDQISRLLYDDLQLPRPAATLKSRHSSTSEKELIKLSNLHPVINLILAHRSAAKIMGTYIDGIRPFIMNESGENQYSIHACFNQTIASTGRLSCSRPNLQSIPKDGLDIAMESCLSSDEQVQSNICPREFFTSRPGCCLISIDYSQVLLCHMSAFFLT